jgi:aerobic carbon-monoxide dehydrogenase medium subunit
MKPPPFQYHDPRTLAEAVDLLGRLDNAKLLAGGQSLMPMLNMRFVLPDHVVDLNRVDALSYIREAGGALEIGAMTRQRDIEFSDLVKAKCPLLHQAIMHIGHRQTRNRGTIGGSLCHLDPAAELVSVAAAHDATVIVAGPNGTREIAFKDFPAGYLTPAIELSEIVTAVRIPLWPAGHAAAFIEFSRRHGDFAIVSAAALLVIDGAKIVRASVTLGGVAVAPVRATDVEQAIIGQAPSSVLFAKACECCRSIEALSDIHASADYRQHLAAVLSRRALEKAAGLANNAPWNRAPWQ